MAPLENEIKNLKSSLQTILFRLKTNEIKNLKSSLFLRDIEDYTLFGVSSIQFFPNMDKILEDDIFLSQLKRVVNFFVRGKIKEIEDKYKNISPKLKAKKEHLSYLQEELRKT